MTGWNLKEGEIQNNSNVNFFSIISGALQSQQGKTTTYKYCFFISLLNISLSSSNLEMGFKEISDYFAKSYWDLINVHGIPQKYRSSADKGSSIEILIKDMTHDHPECSGVFFDNLDEQVKQQYLKESFPIFTSYVVGAFYAETEGYLYGFSKKTKTLTMNKMSKVFLNDNKLLLEQFCYYQWLKMCDSILVKEGKTINDLSQIIENVAKRKSLNEFKRKLVELEDDTSCFYCNSSNSKRFALDHVIPWKFVKTDPLWNLVWCCPRCNSSKNDKLPDKSFIEKLKERNGKLGIESPDICELAKKAKMNGFPYEWSPK